MASSTLAEDLLLEILVRVPVKSLLKCRCVSKSWHSLITNPCFISYQTKHLNSKNDNNDHVMVLQDDILKKQLTWKLCKDNDSLDEITTIDFPFGKITTTTNTNNNNSFTIMGCISGLICLLESVIYQPDSLILWNPVVRKYLVLPSPYSDNNPMTSISVYGFGFANSSVDYRVVRIMQYHIASFFDQRLVGPFAEVYSLSKGSWKSIEPPFAMPCSSSSQQVYSNGSINWLAYNKQFLILRFDSDHETFSEFQLPKDLKGAKINTLKLDKWVESLAIFEVTSYLGVINVWVMKEYGVSTCWSKHLVIESVGIVRSIVGVRKNGDILMNSIERRLVMYDLEKDRFKDSKIEGSNKFQMVSYHESLVLFDDERAKMY